MQLKKMAEITLGCYIDYICGIKLYSKGRYVCSTYVSGHVYYEVCYAFYNMSVRIRTYMAPSMCAMHELNLMCT